MDLSIKVPTHKLKPGVLKDFIEFEMKIITSTEKLVMIWAVSLIEVCILGLTLGYFIDNNGWLYISVKQFSSILNQESGSILYGLQLSLSFFYLSITAVATIAVAILNVMMVAQCLVKSLWVMCEFIPVFIIALMVLILPESLLNKVENYSFRSTKVDAK